MTSDAATHDDESPWNPVDNPRSADFVVGGVPAGWARADHLLVDGLPVAAWFLSPPRREGFTPNAVLAVWTAHLTEDRHDDLLSALGTSGPTDGLILMDPPVVLTNTADAYAQRADAVIQSPFGPLSSRVWHVVRRAHVDDHLSMGRLTVTVTRRDAHLLDGFGLAPRG